MWSQIGVAHLPLSLSFSLFVPPSTTLRCEHSGRQMASAGRQGYGFGALGPSTPHKLDLVSPVSIGELLNKRCGGN